MPMKRELPWASNCNIKRHCTTKWSLGKRETIDATLSWQEASGHNSNETIESMYRVTSDSSRWAAPCWSRLTIDDARQSPTSIAPLMHLTSRKNWINLTIGTNCFPIRSAVISPLIKSTHSLQPRENN
jgi:hypothetical protein